MGDKCFTGWSKDIPATIYFARGNVAISVSSSVSVLEVAQQIDAWLSLSPALVQEAAVDEIEEETPFLAKHFEGSVGEEVLLMKGEADASLRCSITATGGTLMLTEGDRVVLVAQKAGEITVKAYDLDQGIVALRGTATVTIKEQPKE